jgi:hypothetical protein
MNIVNKSNIRKTICTLGLLAWIGAANAATVSVTVEDNGSNPGVTGTLYWAITNANPGDTIVFNLPGPSSTVHFLRPPPTGFPLIYQKHGLTINGYTQPGSSANSNPITAANNALIKVVIDGRANSPGNYHARDMGYGAYNGTLATSDPPIDNSTDTLNPGFDPGAMALIGIYRSTNVTIKGLAFLADNVSVALGTSLGAVIYGIAIAHDYGLDKTIKDALEYPLGDSRGCHIAGCWFGINPENPTKAGVTMCASWINFPRHEGDGGPRPAGNTTLRPELPNVGVTVGVAPGASNPRSEFNVFVGGAYHFGGEPLRLRISGNFVGMMPDGVTPYDMSIENATSSYIFNNLIASTVEFGRYGEDYASSATQGKPMIIGTDGDGVNDADEGNLWGPISGAFGKARTSAPFDHGPAVIHWFRSANNTFLIGGNTWGIGIDGRRFTNSAFFMSGLYMDDQIDGKSKLIIGSDFASTRSAATIAAQANHFYNNYPLDAFGSPPSSLSGVIPFLEYENPNPSSSATTTTNAWVSLRGNVMVGNGLAPVNYANGGTIPNALANFYTSYLDTSVAIIPTLYSGSNYPYLSGTFAPGKAPFTYITVDVYQADPEGWTNGQAFALTELLDPNTSLYNGFAQGKKFIGSFPVPNTGTFKITLPPTADTGLGQITVAVNYSQDPPGTPLARTMTSDFANPVYLLPNSATGIGLTQIVPDVACWYDTVANTVTNGYIKLANQPAAASLGNWEPYISSLGDSTFLIEFNTYANNGTAEYQNNAVAKQPANGGPAKVGYCFYGDNGQPFKGIINYSRQNGNPGRVAGDQRYGANKFITAAEVSIGQDPAFQSVARWANNDMYQGTGLRPPLTEAEAGNRYVGQQIFTMDPITLAQTPVTNAWDYVYGPFVGTVVNTANKPQLARTGGRCNFLDNGNIVVMIDDKTGMTTAANEVTTFSIIQPNGTVIKGPTLAKAQDIFDNMTSVKGGFVIRVHNSLLFYNNSGTLTFSNDCNVSSGMIFGGSPDADGRGDGIRIGGNIRSDYVFVAGVINGGRPSPQIGVAAWDVRTGQFAGKAVVTDGDPNLTQCDRSDVAVDALNRVCVVTSYKPDKTGLWGYQAGARVAQFDGANFSFLGPTFFPFVNNDHDPAAGKGFIFESPVVSMNTKQICFAAKATINSTNNASAGADSLSQQTVYTVVSHPAPVDPPRPTMTITRPDSTHITVNWNADDGLFTVQTRADVASGTWNNATTENVAPPVTLPIGAGPLFVRLAR